MINPIPAIHSDGIRERPSTPTTRLYQEDQIGTFRDNDIFSNFEELTDKHCPLGFQYKKTDTCVIYYKLKFPRVFEAIKVDKDNFLCMYNYNLLVSHHLFRPGLYKERVQN